MYIYNMMYVIDAISTYQDMCNHIQSHEKTIKSHMSPDKTAMSLDSLSIVTTDQNDNVNIPQAINSAKPPLPSSSKRSRSSGQGKQSWLLRLFESKLFDMSIAISYLFKCHEHTCIEHIMTGQEELYNNKKEM
jgi:hypothetical protein